MEQPLDEPRTIHFRATIDKLSLALWANCISNAAVAVAFLWAAMN